MSRIYCGNNYRDQSLINGEKQLGTLYSCLRKGIGTGLNMPIDPAFAGDYEPIDTTRIYCGNSEILPEGYDRMGNLHHCLQKGVGVGKRIRALNARNDAGIVDNFNIYVDILKLKLKII